MRTETTLTLPPTNRRLQHRSSEGTRLDDCIQNRVWFLWDRQHVLLSIRPITRKYKNLRHDPHVAISCLDPANPQHYVEIRGEVVAWELFLDLTFVNRLARKYTGADYTRGYPGEERYKVTVRVDSWTGQGA